MSRSTIHPKARLFEALDLLSQQHSVLDIGLNTLLAQAHVAKASLYQHYDSKDELLVDWLKHRQTLWFQWFNDFIKESAPTQAPLDELHAAFDFLAHWLSRSDFAGCPFVTVSSQLKDPKHPAATQAQRYAQTLLAFLTARLERLHSDTPTHHANVLLSLYLGATVTQKLATSELNAGAHAAAAARALLALWF